MKRTPFKRKTPLKAYAPLRSHTQLKARKPINKISKKKAQQIKQERILVEFLMERCQGKCEKCGQLPDWRGLSKHEIVFRSHGGDPTDPDNCEMLCGKCHAGDHGITEK